MASIVESVVELLLADTDITDLVDNRVNADHLPQRSKMPAVVLWVVSNRALDDLAGPLGMEQPLFRVACYDQSRIGASALLRLVNKALGGFQGVVGGLHIKGVAQEENRGESAATDRVSSGTDQYRFIATQDFRITYDTEVIV